MRVAQVANTGWATKIRPLLPSNYQVIGRGLQAKDGILIAGHDDGSTLDDVIRLLKGNGYTCVEITFGNKGRDPHESR